MSTVRDDADFHEEYTKEFVDYWDDLIGWEGRMEAEAGFFHKRLDAYGLKNILDCASGTGFHSVTLAREGFTVTATDGAPNMVAKTRENAERYGVTLQDTREALWQNLPEIYGEAAFDAVVCLGNSFTHLFDHELRREALRGMYTVVKPGGMVFVDHRNYDDILAHGYSSKHKYYYTGTNVNARPARIDRKECQLEYTFDDGKVFHLHVYPLTQAYVQWLLRDAGFVDVESYGDFERPHDQYDPDFIQQVALKPR